MAQLGKSGIAGPKDLRGGRTLWSDSPHIRLRHRKVLERERCDVAVIGAGISGAIISLLLAEAGQDVVVIDRREPIHGSTLASTAMIQFELDTPLSELADKIGADQAERAYRRSADAVAALIETVARHQIRCGLSERPALYLAGDSMGWRGLRDEAAYRARIGLDSAFLDKSTLAAQFQIDRTGAILSRGAAELNPAQCAAGCLRAAQRYGARLYTPISVEHVEAGPDSVELKTETGGTVVARRVIFATGYEVAPGIPKSDYEIISSWAIATKPLEGSALWPLRCLIWEASDPYLYLRTTVDNRIVAGGEDAADSDPKRRDKAIAAKSRALLAKVEQLLPGRRLEIDYAWAGAFADSPTGLPHIGEVPGMPNCLSVLGCGGNGITFSMVAAQLAQHWVAGRTDPDADLFR
jgi:glycine/D-amino acid oxidase-like deaminating enzyme